jgi:hypothetical protein
MTDNLGNPITQDTVTIKQRLQLPTPSFWKRLGTTCLIIGGVVTAVGVTLASAPLSIPATVTAGLITGGTVFGTIGKVLSSLTVDWNKANESNTPTQ